MKILPILALLFVGATALAQTDTTIYAVQKRAETAEYVLSIPDKWKAIDRVDQTTKDRKYDLTGIALPTELNMLPFIAQFSLRKYACENIRSAEDYIVTEFTSYPDRITPSGRNYDKDSLTIQSGETATFYATNFYRRSKVSNFTRYDMIAYSKKRKAAYMLTITFQYKDPTYAAEANLKLKQYAQRVFKTLLLR